MPFGNQLALSVAVVVGYFLGLLEALEQLPYGQTLKLGAIGLGITVLVGLAGISRRRARLSERIVVSLLRAGLSGGVFVFVFEGMRLLLKIGDAGAALAAWIGAGILGLLLARMAPAGAARQPSTDRASPASRGAYASQRSAVGASARGQARAATARVRPTTRPDPRRGGAQTGATSTAHATATNTSPRRS